MPAITNIYKSIKTTKALEYLQDMVVTGNEMKLLGFAVSSQNGILDPARTIDDILPTWYPVEGQYTPFSIAPANVSTTLSFVMDIPSAVTNNEVYITEIYIFAEYKGETFLFGICQTQVDPPTYRYIPNTGYTQTCSFDLTQYEGNLNIIINQVSGISLKPPLYVDQEGNIALSFNETLEIENQTLQVNPEALISKDSGNRLTTGEDGGLFTKGGGAEGDLGGRISNAIDTFEVNDLQFENIAKGYTTESVTTPTLTSAVSTAFGTEDVFTYRMNTTDATNNANAYLFTENKNWSAEVGLGSPAIGFNIEYCFPQPIYAEKLYWRHGETGTANNNMKSCDLAYSDDGVSWTVFQNITTDTNALGTYFTFDFKPELVRQNGSHRYWACRNIRMYENSSAFNVNLIQWSGEQYTVTDTTSLGYIAVGDLQLSADGRYITGLDETSYLLNKYVVEDWNSYDFRITQKFPQVTTVEPIIAFPNSTQSLYIKEGKLHLFRNEVDYVGNLTYAYNQYYFFRIIYNSKSGYTIQSSTDNLNWTTEIFLDDETNFIRNKTMYLGCLPSDVVFQSTTGTIDLQNTGFKEINGVQQLWTYPINSPCNKECSIIQVTFEGNGLMANGRTAGNLLNNKEWLVNTKNNTIIYSTDTNTLAFDRDNGLISTNYEEFDYAKDDDSSDDQTITFEKDVNETFKYTIVYPNYLQKSAIFETKSDGDTLVNTSTEGSVFSPNTFLEANGFDFTLNMDYTENLTLVRNFDYSRYNTSSLYTTYMNQLGCSWADFTKYINDPTLEVPNGVQFSSYYGDNYNLTALGTAGAIGNISRIGTGDNDWTNPYKNTSVTKNPGFIYFVFNKPVHFTNFLTINYSGTVHNSNRFSVDVSNDFQNWVSVVNKKATGYSENFGGLPIPNILSPNTTANATYTVDLDFPRNGFYRYVRIGVQDSALANKGITRGLWLGGNNAIIANSETLKELVLDDIPFLNNGDDGINLDIVKETDFTAYQVQFEDQLGYVKAEGVKDNLVPKDTPIYADVNCTQQIGTMTHAYEVQCKQWIRNYIDQSTSNAQLGNPISTKANSEYVPIIMMDCTTGTPANAWNAFWDNTTTFDFANGTNRTNYIMRFHERCIVENMILANDDGNNGYSPESIWIEGSNDAYESDNPTWENVLGYENFIKTFYQTGLTDVNGFITGFNGRRYVVPTMKCNYADWSNWEWQVKFKTPTTFSGDSRRILGTFDDSLPLLVGMLSSGGLRIYLGNSSWNIASDGRSTKLLAKDTWYWMKMTFTGAKYVLSFSTDGETYEEYYSVASTAKLTSAYSILLGSHYEDGYTFVNATLDINECRLYADGELYWEPYVQKPLEKLDTRTHWSAMRYNIKLRTDKSYSYYRVGMQRASNRILMDVVRPSGVWIDPVNKQTKNVVSWGDDFSVEGNDRPLRHMMYPVTTSASAIPVDESAVGVASKIATTTAWNVTQFSTAQWDTTGQGNGGKWCALWQFAPYPFRTSVWEQYTHSDTNYLAEDMELFGTNLNDGFAHDTINNTYHRLVNLKTTVDFATSLLSNSAGNKGYYTILSDNTSHIGYRYHKYLFSRSTNYYPVIREMNLYYNQPTTKLIPMYYTHEWKWTNIAGTKGAVHKLGAYDDPFLIPGTSKTVSPSYRVKYNDIERWVPDSGAKGDFLSNGYTDIFSNWSLVGNKNPKNIWAYELRYTDLTGTLHIAYTPDEGEESHNVENGTVLYQSMDFEEPIVVNYAYECAYNGQTGYILISGETGAYVPEGSTIYSEPEFINELGTALVDNWQYNGVVHKKYQYSGNIEKKWQYTGDVDNQYVYTGVVTGWKYTGKSEVVHDEVPHIVAKFNRPNTRQVTKRNQIGVSYPITLEDSIATIGYLYDVSGIVGNYCPVGLTYYTNAQDGIVAGTTDGTQVFQSAIGVDRYSYDYKYLPNTGVADGIMIGSGQVMYYDVDLKEPTDPTQVDSTGYYWDTPTFTSEIGSVSFPVPEATGSGKVYNYLTAGQVINHDGILSGFAKDSYADIPVQVPTNSFEIVIKCNTGASIDGSSPIQASTQYHGFIYRFTKDGTINTWISSNGTAWNIASAYNPGFTGLEVNTTYYLKISWSGLQYNFAISKDGQSWTEGTPIVSSLPILWDKKQGLGGCTWEDYHFQGSIDLNECYLNIDGRQYWTGTTSVGVPKGKKLSISYDTEKYSITYDDTTKEITSGEYIKNKDFQIVSQNMIKLNLTKSKFSWWTWNNLTKDDIKKSQNWLFRIGTIDGSPGNIEEIIPLNPWKIGEGGGSGISMLTSEGKVKPINKLYVADGTEAITSEKGIKLAKGKNLIALNAPGAIMASTINPSGSGKDKTFSNGGNLICYAPTTINLIAGTSGVTTTFTNFVGIMGIPSGYRVTSGSTFNWSE